MAGSPKKRSKPYVQKFVKGALPPIFRFAPGAEARLINIPHAALATMKSGQGTMSHWSDITTRLNMAVEMARSYFNEESRLICWNALKAQRTIYMRRLHKTDKWIMTGDEIVAIGAGLEQADEMQGQVTRRELLLINSKIAESQRKFDLRPEEDRIDGIGELE